MPAPSPAAADEADLLKRATACLQEKDLGNAIVHLKALLGADANHELALGMLAAVYAQLKMTQRAEEYFRRVLAVNPANPLARFQLGLVQFSANRWDAALDTLRPGLGGTNEFLARFYSGAALLSLGRPDEARPLLEQAAQDMPAEHPLHAALQELLSIAERSRTP